MFPLDISYLRPNLGDANRLYWRYLIYVSKVLGIEYSDLIGYWPMNEAGGSTAFDKSSQGNDGAYTGVTLGQVGIGDGLTCPLFDGANGYNNVYSAGLNADFDKDEGSLIVWAKVSGVGVWTDGVYRYMVNLEVDSNNLVRIYKSVSDNVVNVMYKAGGTISSRSFLPVSDLDWMSFGLTWSVSGDVARHYKDGVEHIAGATSGLGAWVGNLHANKCNFGSQDVSPLNPFDGYEAHGILYKKALTQTQMGVLGAL